MTESRTLALEEDALNADYVDAMRTRAPLAETRLDAECAAFDAAITPLQRSRLVAGFGIDPETPPSRVWRDRSADAVVDALLPVDRQSLSDLVRSARAIAPRRHAHWLDRFAALGVIAGRPGACVVSPYAVAALARVLAPIESAAWDAVAGPPHAAATTLVSAEAAMEAAAGASLMDAQTGTRPRDLEAAIWQHCAVAARASDAFDAALATLAGRVRKTALVSWHLPHAPAPPRALLANPNGAAPWWEHVQPGPLIAPDLPCLSAWFAEVPAPVDTPTAVAALALCPTHPLCQHLPEQTASREEVLRALPRTALRAGVTIAQALVQPDALREGALSWADVLGLASVAGVGEAVEGLLDDDVDWTDFDAVGEGELPRLWRDVLRCSPVWDAAWASRFEALLDEAALPPSEVLAGYPCPRVARASRLSVEHSPMSSYVHGLNDGTAEAYGDVHAPADPFSDR
jgi:hypothetical protein